MTSSYFDTHLQDRGFGNSNRQPVTSTDLNAVVIQPRQSQPAQQSQQSNPMMGAAAGIGMKFAGGGSGGSGGSFGGSWAGVPGGAISGWMAGEANYRNNPNMTNKKDGFGEHYQDYRSRVGGAIGGGVLGYYGLGSIAGPAVTAAHPIMEPVTRWLINTGDSFGGAGGALMMDPIGTVASGKYSGEELAKGALFGPFTKLFT